jgi:hypothetical protein
MKRKGITLIELIVIISIIGVILAILLPLFHFTPRTGTITICAALIVAILVVAIGYMIDCNPKGKDKMPVIAFTILGCGVVGFTGWQLTKNRPGSGRVQVMSWEYKISLSDGNDTRTERCEGFNKEPKKDYIRYRDEKETSAKLTCYMYIDNGNGSKRYQIDRDLWEKINENQMIEFEYQLIGRYITKVY